MDLHHMQNDLGHFDKSFKTEYFAVQEQEDTASDLTHVRPQPKEPSHRYLARLNQILAKQV